MTPRDYAVIAQEAYNPPPDIGDENSASRAIVRQTPGGLVIAFEGTNNWSSILTDANIDTTDIPFIGKIHNGFWNAWQSIAVDVLAAINGQPVTLVGHSLGAAIALCAYVDMTAAGNPPLAVYGFEPPRVSPHPVPLSVNNHVYLYKNGNDLVPDLPPGWWQGVVNYIGVPMLPFPNVQDHEISRVITAL